MPSPPRTGALPYSASPLAPWSIAKFVSRTAFVVLIASAASFLLFSRHWPLVGDSAQIHYICFLMDHGLAPYRVTGDMNMPGALLLEWLVMHAFGVGSLAWRCFDLSLLTSITVAMAVVTGKGHRFAGVAAGCLFAVLHGVDGLNDTGERDLSIAAFLLLGYAFLFSLLRRLQTSEVQAWKACAFAFCAGAAASIKPTILPLVFVLLTTSATLLFRLAPRRRAVQSLMAASAVLLLPFAVVLIFLLWQHAFIAFFHGLPIFAPYYASLDRRPLPYLLLHSVAPLLPALICWIAGPAWLQPLSLERKLLFIGSAFALLSYLLQWKGFPYYRYPLLALLLPLAAVDCTSAFFAFSRPRVTARLAAVLACIAVIYAAVLSPLLVRKAHAFRWDDLQFITSLTQDLQTVHAANRQVQCIDSISGCGNTLLRLQLVQTTGLLSDFFIFGSPQSPAVRESRESFRAAISSGEVPRYVIVTDDLHLHPEDPGNWNKLNAWPWLTDWLRSNYTLVLTRTPTRAALWWARPELPAAYRIYVLNRFAAIAEVALARKAGLPADPSTPLLLNEP